MKLFSSELARPLTGCRQLQAFTLIEAMFSIGTLIILIMALLSAQFMGMRLDQIVESKQGASDTSRKVINVLPSDIKSSKMWNIGNLSGTNFTLIPGGSPQRGPALELFQTTNGSQYILYYFTTNSVNTSGDASSGNLWRTSSTNWNPVVIASNLINTLYFTAENYQGVVATNDGSSMAYKNVIHTILQFCQFEYPLTVVGTNGLYDYYKMEFRATPHLHE